MRLLIPLTFSLTLAACLIATGALAQNTAAPPGAPTPGSAATGAAADLPGHGPAGPVGASTAANPATPARAATGTLAPASAIAPDLPANWPGSPADWTAHAQACSKAHPSYNVVTDTYLANGQAATCAASVGTSLPATPSGAGPAR